MTAEKILDRIRALLAKAESTTHDGEREVYLAKAIELIAKYGIDEALLAAKADTRQIPGHRRITIDGAYSKEKASLLGWLVEAFGGQAVLHNRGRKAVAVTLIGFEADLERTELLYTSLLLQAMRQLAQVRPEADPWAWEGPSRQSVAAFRRSWFVGFASRVTTRVRAAEKGAVQEATRTEGTSTALVLVDRKAQVEQYKVELFPKLGKPRTHKVDPHAYRQGTQAGDRADIGGKRVGATTRRALA